MPMYSNVKAVRNRAWHYLSDEVAGCAGMNANQLIQFCLGNFHPTPEQIHALAIRLRLYPPPPRGSF